MKKKFNIVEDLVKPVISAVIIAFICTQFLFRFVVVDGHSMEPTLHDRAWGVSLIFPKYFSTPNRFDIVVIKNNNIHIVKRVIGLPGEHVQYSNGVLKINGEVVPEDFISDDVKLETGDIDITLGENQYFVMGDNRGHSSDSRYYGPFDIDQIVARDVYIILGK